MKILRKLAALFRKEKLDVEMADEMRHHVELQTELNLKAGLNAEDARYAALRQFGNVAGLQEQARDQRGLPWLEELLRDLRFAWRMLAKNPGFTAVVVITLALGVGANTALFSVVHAAVLQAPPFPEAGQLVRVNERKRDAQGLSVAYPNFRDWREQQTVFSHFGAYRPRPYALSGVLEPIQITVGEISPELLEGLRVRPALGRLFTAEEDKPGGAPAILLGDSLWRDQFGLAPDIVGRVITLDMRAYTVVGVMPRGFAFPRNAVAWLPLGRLAVGSDWENRGSHSGLFALGRLKPGITMEAARLQFEAIAARLEAHYPVDRGRGVRVMSLQDAMANGAGGTLWPLLGAAGLVLLIACANVANLLLARAAVRRREMAVRAALGAGRGRILRQLFAESLLLAGVGGTAGVLLAHWALAAIIGVMAPAFPRVAEAQLNAPVLLFSVSMTAFAAVIFGLVPAWRASQVSLQETMQSASRGSSGRQGRLRHGLVVIEFALTILLLTGAGLLLRSLVNLQAVNPGFAAEQTLAFRVNLSTSKYPAVEQRLEFFRDLLERLRGIPGVKAATVASRVPLDGDNWENEFAIEGRPEPEPGARPLATMNRIEPDYFRTLGITLLQGRFFDRSDGPRPAPGTGQAGNTPATPLAIIIDEEFARRYWPGEDPIGRQVRFTSGPRENQPVTTVVGVVSRVKFDRLSEDGGMVQAYVPLTQWPRARVTVLLRATGEPAALAAAARQEVLALDPHQPIFGVTTLDGLIENSASAQRVNLTLLGIFSLVALALAAVGLYGVLSYLVAQREREIGVRMALGARQAEVVRLVLGEGARLAAAGLAIGLPAAFGLSRLLDHLLYGVTARDPLTFLAVPLLLGAVALLACWLPARRAAKVDPMIALRAE